MFVKLQAKTTALISQQYCQEHLVLRTLPSICCIPHTHKHMHSQPACTARLENHNMTVLPLRYSSGLFLNRTLLSLWPVYWTVCSKNHSPCNRRTCNIKMLTSKLKWESWWMKINTQRQRKLITTFWGEFVNLTSYIDDYGIWEWLSRNGKSWLYEVMLKISLPVSLFSQ